jgi:thioredoxin 1
MQTSKDHVLKFYADWCQPCKVLTHQIKKLSEDYDLLEITNIDVEHNKDTAKFYNVSGIPSLIRVDYLGNEVNRVTGLVNGNKLLSILKGNE